MDHLEAEADGAVVCRAEWVFFDGDPQRSRVVKEIRGCKLSNREAARLDGLMDRVANGMAIPGSDIKHLKVEGLWEVRFRGEKRIFRLLYSPESDGRLVLVALRFTAKTSQKLPQHVFESARERLRRWRRAQGGD